MSDLINISYQLEEIDRIERQVISDQNAIRFTVRQAIDLISGRIKDSNVCGIALRELKRELADYDAKECKWKQ